MDWDGWMVCYQVISLDFIGLDSIWFFCIVSFGVGSRRMNE